MNIAFAYPTVINPIKGGVERVTFLLSQEFVKRGHNVHFVHNVKSELPEIPFNVTTSFFPYESYADKRNINWYHDYLKKHKIDIVINQCGQFGDSLLYCNTGGQAKVISVAHMSPEINLNCLYGEISKLRTDGNPFEPLKRIGRILIYPYIYFKTKRGLKRHYDWIADKTDRFVLLSERFYKDLRMLTDVNLKLTSIPNPLSFNPNLPDKKENVVLWVGRMDYQKRPDLMIKIWKKAKLKGWRLVMIGDGKLMNKMKKAAKEYNSIEIVGYTDPLSYYRNSKILCMTSGHEGFGMVLTEAMSQGCVPMAFHSFSSVYDIIPDSKRLVKPLKIKEYIKKLQLISSDSSFEDISRQCVEDSKKFEITSIVNQWEDIFKELTE